MIFELVDTRENAVVYVGPYNECEFVALSLGYMCIFNTGYVLIDAEIICRE